MRFWLDILADALLLGVVISWLFVFGWMARYGEFLFWEDSRTILVLETTAFVMLLIFAVGKLAMDCRSLKPK